MDNPPARDSRRWIVGGSVALLLAVWLVWWQWDGIAGFWSGERAADGSSAIVAEPAPVNGGEADAAGQTLAEREWIEQLGEAPHWPEDLVEPQSCEDVEAGLARICAVLDGREYVRAAAPPGGTCGLLRTVAGELAVRPPELTSELKNYPIMLENVFYIYRALGRERLSLVRRIQFEEQVLAEPAAMAIYRWLASREGCASASRTTMTTEALYGYAGYFFTTMGGQAYLRRRSPRIEALASFYALLFLERAQRADHDPAGVDPRAEIQRTRDLIASQPLVFRDHYLVLLDRMAESWKRRGESS
ncbi:MAG TPA: hypothetical protein VD788_12905 [Candidatus Polarisedimenticolaceae bacterium]|nr:hypothetical protein [Candidatus Polarisedimenticolaceae bacterium]